MKIAVFSDTYDQINGVAVTYKHLVEYASRKGYEIDIFTQGDEDSVEDFGSARVFRFKPERPLKFYTELYFDLKIPNRKMLEKVKEEEYDVIHTAAVGSMGFNAMIIAKRLDIPLVGSYNTDIPKYIRPRVDKVFRFLPRPLRAAISKPLEFTSRQFIKTYFRKCDKVLTISDYNKVQLENLIKKEVDIFSRGVDVEMFDPSKRSEEIRAKYNTTLAIYVGRVSVEKNLEILIDVFKERDDVRLIVVGDGPFREEMQRRLPTAIFTGPIYDREELAAYYASADFFIFPSETETFGQVITEAMASGLATVVSDKGASHEQVAHGESGLIFNTKEDLRSHVERLATGYRDRLEMGKNARNAALTRTWDAVFDRLMQQYMSALPKDTRESLPLSQIILETE